METINFTYRLEERPPLMELLAFALQWFVITAPLVIILGKVGAGSLGDPAAQLVYMQKLFLVTGIAWLLQLQAGHRLPVIVGPASILLWEYWLTAVRTIRRHIFVYRYRRVTNVVCPFGLCRVISIPYAGRTALFAAFKVYSHRLGRISRGYCLLCSA